MLVIHPCFDWHAAGLYSLQVIFLHPAPMHPHIYSNGHICLGNLSFYAYMIDLSYDLFLEKVVP